MTTLGNDKQTSLAQAARMLVAESRRGILSTLLTDSGYPYGSLVELAPLDNGDVVLFLSSLAEHQRYLTADPRASIHIAPAWSAEDAMAQPRVTLVGRVELASDRAEMSRIYLARHPHAQSYASFADFNYYRLHVERVRFIAGFGRMGWIKAKRYQSAGDQAPS